jgi:septal ring factor EnvC (AmiA/AmiB activator)
VSPYLCCGLLCNSLSVCLSLSSQQLLSLQDQLRSKEVELEQARDEHRYLEGEVLALRDKVREHTHTDTHTHTHTSVETRTH